MFRQSLHKIKNYYLRKRYGCGCCDAFSLYFYLAKTILPCLRVFKLKAMGYPAEFSEKEWDDVLNKMIRSFELVLQDDHQVLAESEHTEMQEGLELFGKYFRNLWY